MDKGIGRRIEPKSRHDGVKKEKKKKENEKVLLNGKKIKEQRI